MNYEIVSKATHSMWMARWCVGGMLQWASGTFDLVGIEQMVAFVGGYFLSR